MRLLFLVAKHTLFGKGHEIRSRVLSDYALEKGHAVEWHALPSTPVAIDLVLRSFKPDWVVADVHDNAIALQYLPSIREFKSKLALLNGRGNGAEAAADCAFVQGFIETRPHKNVFVGPEYVLLRREAFKTRPDLSSPYWFVFGGYLDIFNLRQAFASVVNERAYLVGPSSAALEALKRPDSAWVSVYPGDGIFDIMAQSSRALVSFGMIVWELIAARFPEIKVCVPNIADRPFADELKARGAISVWYGEPSRREEFKQWLLEPFESDCSRIPLDDKAPERILQKLEELR